MKSFQPALRARPRRRPRASGILLFEVILALSVFSVAVVALAICLQRTIESFNLAQMEVYVQEQLANRVELSRLQTLAPGHLEEKADQRGVSYVRDIEALNLQTKRRIPVSGLLRMRWTATWPGPAGPQTKTFEVYVANP